MEKYKVCPGCGHQNNPRAIECEVCGEDLSSVRILDAQTQEQLGQRQIVSEKVKMIRICEECGARNEAQARKCAQCGEDISMIIPVPDEEQIQRYSFITLDGETMFMIPEDGTAVTVGREQEWKEYLQGKYYVSRNHAQIRMASEGLQIRSFSTSGNGTHVNGQMIIPDEWVILNDGDVVGLGGNDPEVQTNAAYFRVTTV